MDSSEYIKPFTFVTINHNDLAEEHGIKEGDTLFVAGAKAFPLTEDDPYTQRVFMFVQKMAGDMIDDEGGFFVMDPHSLSNVSKEENDRLSLINLSMPDDAQIN